MLETMLRQCGKCYSKKNQKNKLLETVKRLRLKNLLINLQKKLDLRLNG